MSKRPQVGDYVRVVGTRRCGRLLVDDTSELPFKVAFADGLLPAEDWVQEVIDVRVPFFRQAGDGLQDFLSELGTAPRDGMMGPKVEEPDLEPRGPSTFENMWKVVSNVTNQFNMLTLNVETMGGSHLTATFPPSLKLSEFKSELYRRGGPVPKDQKVVVGSHTADNNQATLAELGMKSGDIVNLVCAPYCDVCRGSCNCLDCHGRGRYVNGCELCGLVIPPRKKSPQGCSWPPQ